MTSFIRGKRLIILGGGYQHCKVVETAKKLGLITYVVDNLTDSPAKLVADYSFFCDVNDLEGLVEICHENRIDGAINVSFDPCQIPYYKLCKAMGFYCYGNEEQFDALTKKDIFKEICSKHGLHVIDGFVYTASQLSSTLLKDMEHFNYPVIVKPADSRGSRGQMICRSEKDIKKATENVLKESKGKTYIIESYFENSYDFTVAYLVKDGIPILVRTGDRHLGNKSEGLERVCVATVSPSDIMSVFLSEENEKLSLMINKMGIKNGPVFFQALYHEGNFYYYDPGFRFGGVDYESALKQLTGIDIIQPLLEYAISGKMISDIPEGISNLEKRIVQLFPCLYPGKIKSISGIDKIDAMREVISISLRYREGDSVPDSGDIRRRLGEICIICEGKKLKRVIQQIYEYLTVKNSLDENMVINCLDQIVPQSKQGEKM
jgi:biotin carboxylase